MTPLVLYALAFAGLSILVGLLLAAKHVPVVARLSVAAATPWLALAVWQAAQPPAGWPKAARPPAGSTFVGGVARLPTLDDPGEIDLWVEPPGVQRPRAYRLPYSPVLHRRLNAALAAERATHGAVNLAVQNAAGTGRRVGGRSTLRFVMVHLPAKAR